MLTNSNEITSGITVIRIALIHKLPIVSTLVAAETNVELCDAEMPIPIRRPDTSAAITCAFALQRFGSMEQAPSIILDTG